MRPHAKRSGSPQRGATSPPLAQPQMEGIGEGQCLPKHGRTEHYRLSQNPNSVGSAHRRACHRPIRDVERSIPEEPLTGVPFLLKDLVVSYAGVPTNCGSRLLEGFTRDFDSELLVRWKRAGLVVIGKTNTPELGSNGSTEPVANGPSRNPWNLGHSTGGSSGGSAAAVAAGIVPAAHASDGGGSIRGPASNCGVVGLKPTRGRNPLGPDAGEMWNGLVAEHVVSRTVRDTALILDCTAGADVGDP